MVIDNVYVLINVIFDRLLCEDCHWKLEHDKTFYDGYDRWSITIQGNHEELFEDLKEKMVEAKVEFRTTFDVNFLKWHCLIEVKKEN